MAYSLNRRGFLRGIVLTAGASLLAACGGTQPNPTAAPAKPTEAPDSSQAQKAAPAAPAR